jgi:hypothetical protein
MRLAIIKSLRRERSTLFVRRGHDRGVRVARSAVFAFGLFHGAAALMFAMAGGAGIVAHDIRLMKFVLGVAAEASKVDGGHVAFGDTRQLPKLQQTQLVGKRRVKPSRRTGLARRMTRGTAALSTDGGHLQPGESRARMMR